jgi:AcrR family transcriptional regulator
VSPAPRSGGPRGPYAKTEERRTQILDTALDVFARRGYRGGSLREIAERVGLSDAGVLHHFGSKQQLLIAVLEHRDAIERRRWSPEGQGLAFLDGLRGMVEYDATVPGVIQLFVTLSAEATDPDHPAHAFFVARYQNVASHFVDRLTTAQEAGEIGPEVDLARAAQLLIAVLDGLQVQWLLDDKLDMVAAFDQFLDGFRRSLGAVEVVHEPGADAVR